MMINLAMAFLTAALIAGLVRAARVLDRPNDRSNHSDPTPRSGGLGVLAGFFAGVALLAGLTPAAGSALGAIAAVSALVGLVGLADDLTTLSERLKFFLLAALSVALAAGVGPVTDLGYALPWIIGLIGSALWIFTVMNAVNFMDGSDGILVATLIPAALALAIMGDGAVTAGGLILAAALAGFAIWNIPVLGRRGSLFAGDIGSLGSACLFAGLALYWAVISPSGSVWLAPLLVMPILADVLLTMAARFKAGRRLFAAHRAHAYQLLIRMGVSHARIALIWGGLSLGFGALAMIGNAGEMWVKPAVFLLGVVLAVIGHRIVRTKARAAGLDVTR
jgi:UDP-N-acetylmuramyl pentapeptide phosphotransferase/UDP-N-acetylglucosamine-1-phosphate transferase